MCGPRFDYLIIQEWARVNNLSFKNVRWTPWETVRFRTADPSWDWRKGKRRDTYMRIRMPNEFEKA